MMPENKQILKEALAGIGFTLGFVGLVFGSEGTSTLEKAIMFIIFWLGFVWSVKYMIRWEIKKANERKP